MTRARADAGGVSAIRAWLTGLEVSDDGKLDIRPVVQRVVHPGLEPLGGEGFIAAQPLGRADTPGSWPRSATLLHWFEPINEANVTNLEHRDRLIGALLTLVTDRRCEVVPEVLTKIEGQDNTTLIPLAGQVDAALGSPMPPWENIDHSLRMTLAQLTSMPDAEANAVVAAMQLHYSASLLAGSDFVGAYAMAVGGLEVLSQQFGSPPSEWDQWDKATEWDAFIGDQRLTDEQAHALRARLMRDRHMRLAENFATYVVERLPAGHWKEPVSNYMWGVDGLAGTAIEGSWEAGRPRGASFGDKSSAKRALKKTYQARSLFIHAGQRLSDYTSEFFGDVAGRHRDMLSLAQVRSALRALILLELNDRATDARLPEIEFRFTENRGRKGRSHQVDQ